MKLNLNTPPKPGPVPSQSRDVPAIVRGETLAADAAIHETDQIVAQPVPEIIDQSELPKPVKGLTRLVDENFPFDESQLEAIDGLSREKHGCMTGAAGTGKTTCTKAVVDRIVDELPRVNMGTYFKKDYKPEDQDDDYEAPEELIPAVALVAYTGRASQMIKKNFPRDWHGNIMTIHRLLAFYPEWYDDFEDLNEAGEAKRKVKFIPAYTAANKLPWKVIIIDEAGMLGLDLWHQLLDACTADTRIIMIGDINQLPPTHGKSVFGFAMARWPSWELTHIHRQQGVNNSIVDNAWRIINGNFPKTDDPKSSDWKFVMMEIDPEPNKASRQVRKWLDTIRITDEKPTNLYDPIRDTVITPINGYKEESAGYMLGQDPMNRELAMTFNSDHGRYIIDAGRERKYFAEGDKVMATKNNHEAGITNGMTGVIETIRANGAYQGNSFRYGLIEDVNAYLADVLEFEEEEFSLEDLAAAVGKESEKKEKESRDRGPASHIVTVRFGHGDSSFTMDFTTLAEVATLMTAYVVTCHKMQGGEAPFIVVICHQAHKRMLDREWLYTAVTRASERCVVLYTRMGMSAALNKQNIKGRNLKEKVESFNKMIDPKGLLGAAIRIQLPEPECLEGDRSLVPTRTMLEQEAHTVESTKTVEEERPPEIEVTPTTVIHVDKVVVNRIVAPPPPLAPAPKQPVDGGDLKPEPKKPMTLNLTRMAPTPHPVIKHIEYEREDTDQTRGFIRDMAIVADAMRKERAPLVPQWGAVRMLHRLRDESEKKLLTYQPKREETLTFEPVKPKPLNLWQLVQQQRAEKGI